MRIVFSFLALTIPRHRTIRCAINAAATKNGSGSAATPAYQRRKPFNNHKCPLRDFRRVADCRFLRLHHVHAKELMATVA